MEKEEHHVRKQTVYNLSQQNISRKAFIVIGIAATLNFLKGDYKLRDLEKKVRSPGKITFLQAKENEGLRERYVSQIISELKVPEYVDSIRYVSKEEFVNNSDLENLVEPSEKLHTMKTYPSKTADNLLEIGNHSYIVVFPYSFENKFFSDEVDLKNVLEWHELQHSLQIYNWFEHIGLNESDFIANSGRYNFLLFNILSEIDAHASEINSPDFYKTSRKYKNSVKDSFLVKYSLLWADIDIDNFLRRKLIDRYKPLAKELGAIKTRDDVELMRDINGGEYFFSE